MQNWLKEEQQWRPWAGKVLRHLKRAFPFPEYETRKTWLKYLPHALAALEARQQSNATSAENSVLFVVGECYFLLGQYQEAEHMYQESLRLRQEALGKEHTATLDCMNNLADIYRFQGKFEQAEQMHRETLRLKRKVAGDEHPTTLACMNNLATALGNLGRHAEAEEMFQFTLEAKQRVLGETHPDTLHTMNNLAMAVEKVGEIKRRSKCTERPAAAGARHWQRKPGKLQHPVEPRLHS